MAQRFVLPEFGPTHVQGPLVAADGTGPSAVGTRLLLAQGGGLAFEQRLQSAFGETGGRRLGDLLHGVEINLKSGAIVAEGAAGDDFAPLGGELAEFVEVVRRQVAPCHAPSSLELASSGRE